VQSAQSSNIKLKQTQPKPLSPVQIWDL